MPNIEEKEKKQNTHSDKGKPWETAGRKATGLKLLGQDSRVAEDVSESSAHRLELGTWAFCRFRDGRTDMAGVGGVTNVDTESRLWRWLDNLLCSRWMIVVVVAVIAVCVSCSSGASMIRSRGPSAVMPESIIWSGLMCSEGQQVYLMNGSLNYRSSEVLK